MVVIGSRRSAGCHVDMSPAAPINSRLNAVVRSPTPFRLGRNECWPSGGYQIPHTNHFFAVLPSKQPQKRSTQSLSNRSTVFSPLLPLSCPYFHSFFLISGNVYPNPDPIFSCSVIAENVAWRGRSMQCCTCSKWVRLGVHHSFSSNSKL